MPVSWFCKLPGLQEDHPQCLLSTWCVSGTALQRKDRPPGPWGTLQILSSPRTRHYMLGNNGFQRETTIPMCAWMLLSWCVNLPTNDMFMGDTTLQPWQPWLQGHCALFASAECNPHSSHLAWVRKHARLSVKVRHRLSNYLIIYRSLNWAVSIRSNSSVACAYKGLIFVRITFWEVAVELPFVSETRESSLRHLKWDLASWWWAHLGAFKRLTPWPIGGWSSWIQRPTRVGWMNGQLGWVEWMCWMSKGMQRRCLLFSGVSCILTLLQCCMCSTLRAAVFASLEIWC